MTIVVWLYEEFELGRDILGSLYVDWSSWRKLGGERCAGVVLLVQPDRWTCALSWGSVLNQDGARKSGRGRVVDEEEWSSVSSASRKDRPRTVDVSQKCVIAEQHDLDL